MAVGPKPILTNGVGSPQSIWEAVSNPHHEVGSRAQLGDGRVFYYARNSGAAIVAGQLLTVELQTAQFTGLAVNTAAVGDTTLSITLGSTAVTADEYARGYVHVIDDTGEGITYKIDTHPAVSASSAGTFTLKDPIVVAFVAATTVELTKNPWADTVIAPAGQGHVPAGISQVAVGSGATTQQYFWCQTWGPTCAWMDEAVTVGQEVTSGATAGQVETVDALAECRIGYCISIAGVAGEYQPVFLQIAP